MKPDRINLIAKIIYAVAGIAAVMALFMWLRCSFEARHVSGDNMSPELKIGDYVIFDMMAYKLGRTFERGQIVLFYPYYVQVQPAALSGNPIYMIDRAIGAPSLNHPQSSIKRVIGLPGDKIEIKRNQGVFVNGKLLKETYVKEAAAYELDSLQDIGGELAANRGMICPFPGNVQPVVVPPGSLFVLGDNRNYSEDSHQWGFLKQDRVLGWAIAKPFPWPRLIARPTYE